MLTGLCVLMADEQNMYVFFIVDSKIFSVIEQRCAHLNIGYLKSTQ